MLKTTNVKTQEIEKITEASVIGDAFKRIKIPFQHY
jgi:hypothetical protein